MKRLVVGIVVAVTIVIAAGLAWYELDDQARGVVVGVLLGTGGVVVGILLALAVVAVFLLIQLRWSVNQGARPPVFLPNSTPALPPAAQAHQWFTQRRPPRQWTDVVGGDDAESLDETLHRNL